MSRRAHIELESLKRAVKLSSLVSAKVPLKRAGKDFIGMCPFHAEQTPSFTVSDAKGFFHCFGCGAHGDHVSWLMHAENLTFYDAVERLGGTVGDAVARPYRDHKARQDEARTRSMAHWLRTVPLEGSIVGNWLRYAHGLRGPYMGIRYDSEGWYEFADGRPYPIYAPLVGRVDDEAGELAAVYKNSMHGVLGDPGAGGVRCGDARPVMALTASLVGALWVHERYNVPCWCALSEERLNKVWLPEICTDLTIFAGIGDTCWNLAMNAADHFETATRNVVIEPLGERIYEQRLEFPESPFTAVPRLDPDQVAGG